MYQTAALTTQNIPPRIQRNRQSSTHSLLSAARCTKLPQVRHHFQSTMMLSSVAHTCYWRGSLHLQAAETCSCHWASASISSTLLLAETGGCTTPVKPAALEVDTSSRTRGTGGTASKSLSNLSKPPIYAACRVRPAGQAAQSRSELAALASLGGLPTVKYCLLSTEALPRPIKMQPSQQVAQVVHNCLRQVDMWNAPCARSWAGSNGRHAHRTNNF